jgi:GTP cyclohydrolase I
MIKEMKNYEKEQYNAETTALLAENYKTIIHGLGEDVTREGLKKNTRKSSNAVSNSWLCTRSTRNFKRSSLLKIIAK